MGPPFSKSMSFFSTTHPDLSLITLTWFTLTTLWCCTQQHAAGPWPLPCTQRTTTLSADQNMITDWMEPITTTISMMLLVTQ